MYPMYGIVRDANGVPKFDDPTKVPQPIKDALTPEDLAKLDSKTLRDLGFNPKAI